MGLKRKFPIQFIKFTKLKNWKYSVTRNNRWGSKLLMSYCSLFLFKNQDRLETLSNDYIKWLHIYNAKDKKSALQNTDKINQSAILNDFRLFFHQQKKFQIKEKSLQFTFLKCPIIMFHWTQRSFLPVLATQLTVFSFSFSG